MKRNISNSLALFVIVLFAFGCKPKRIIVTTPPVSQEKVEVDKKPENLALLKSKDLPFNTLALRGKANLNVDGDENNVTMIDQNAER